MRMTDDELKELCKGLEWEEVVVILLKTLENYQFFVDDVFAKNVEIYKAKSEECCKALEMAIEALSAEKTTNKININEYVKVNLTDYGKEIFYHQYDNLNKAYGKEIIKPSYPTVDSDGYTSFQLWYFMNLYGRYIDMGEQNVIEPLEIVFESAEKTDGESK